MGKRKQKNNNQQDQQNQQNQPEAKRQKKGVQKKGGQKKGGQKKGGQKKGGQKKGGQKKGAFTKNWIEVCRESKNVTSTTKCDMLVYLSRVELSDDHNPNGNSVTSSDFALPSSEIDEEVSFKSVSTTIPPIADHVTETTTKESDEPCYTNLIDIIDDDKKQVSTTSSETGTEKVSEDSIEGSKTSVINESKDYSHSFIKVVRAPSAKYKPKTKDKAQKKFKHLPNGDAGDGVINPYPKNEVADKYWAQRKRLFSKFDQGIKLDKEGWFSVTPEAIANHIATRVVISVSKNKLQEQNGAIVLDAFCGCGGNAIAFALKSEISTVICVDYDRNKLRMAAHNASIYEVDPKRIIFIEADSLYVMRGYSEGRRSLDIESNSKEAIVTEETCKGYIIGGLSLLPSALDAIFLSPPWGGMNYLNEGKMGYEISNCIKVSKINFQLEGDNPSKAGAHNGDVVDGDELLLIAARAARQKNVLYFLPRNVNGISLGRSALKAGYTKIFELEQNVLNGKLKTITAYYHDQLDIPK